MRTIGYLHSGQLLGGCHILVCFHDYGCDQVGHALDLIVGEFAVLQHSVPEHAPVVKKSSAIHIVMLGHAVIFRRPCNYIE